jgi:capsular polysaccharide export protein
MTRTFLFLQGPPGPFFRQVADALTAQGARCLRVNLNGGDRIDWGPGGQDYADGLAAWPAFLADLLVREGVTDVALFGDCRPYHQAAGIVARAAGVAVNVFEEGYVRPDWITLEHDGVNGHSRLPRDARAYLAHAALLPPLAPLPPIPASFARRAWEAARYYAAAGLLAPRHGGYRTHRPDGIAAEARGWLVRLAARPLARLRSARALGRLGTEYFVLPLQLDSDHQIRIHSPFRDMGEVIARVVASFAAHAAPGATLLVKEHPLDNGLRPWRRIVRAAARRGDRRGGAGGRVLFVEHGHVDRLVAGARGVVTVNSTTGTLALAAGTPVIVLGAAVYDLPGLTARDGLDRFWRDPVPPRAELWDAFRRVLVHRCLLRGGFSSVAGRAHLVPATVERLLAGAWADDAPLRASA